MSTRAEIERRRAAFARALEDAEENPSSLSRKSGVPRSTITSFLRGKTASFTGANERKIAAALGCSVEALYGDESPTSPTQRFVLVAGSIGRGLAVSFHAAFAKGEARAIPAPPGEPTRGFLYFEITAEGAPFGPPGWMLRVMEQAQPAADLVGSPVIAELADGTRWLGQLRQWGERGGRFQIYRWGVGEPVDNVSVTSAHRVVGSFDPDA